jgi:DNA-binding transcriptional regulator YhcF (GntR family)
MTTSSTRPPTTATPEAVANVVRRFAAAKGFAPSFREIGDELGIELRAARAAVHQAEAAGTIERRAGCRRAIRAVDPERGRRRS